MMNNTAHETIVFGWLFTILISVEKVNYILLQPRRHKLWRVNFKNWSLNSKNFFNNYFKVHYLLFRHLNNSGYLNN